MKITMTFEEYPEKKPEQSRKYFVLESDQDGYHDLFEANYDKDRDIWFVYNNGIEGDKYEMELHNIVGWDPMVNMPSVRTNEGKLWFRKW